MTSHSDTDNARVAALLSAYLSPEMSAKLASKFESLTEVKQFLAALLPREEKVRTFKQHHVFRADTPFKRTYMQETRDRGLVVFKQQIGAGKWAVTRTTPTMFTHFRGDKGVVEVT